MADAVESAAKTQRMNERPLLSPPGPTPSLMHRKPSMPSRPLLASSTAPVPTSAIRAAFLNVKDAALYLGLSPHTLYVWRHRRKGPPSFWMGSRGRVMYRLEALDAWIREQEQADSRSNPALNPLSAAAQQPSRRSA